MARFTTRVELYGSPTSDDYEKLNKGDFEKHHYQKSIFALHAKLLETRIFIRGSKPPESSVLLDFWLIAFISAPIPPFPGGSVAHTG